MAYTKKKYQKKRKTLRKKTNNRRKGGKKRVEEIVIMFGRNNTNSDISNIIEINRGPTSFKAKSQPEHTNSEYESPSLEVQPNISQSDTQAEQSTNSESLYQRIKPVFDAIEILNKKEKIKEEEYYKLKQALEAVCRD